MTDSPPQETASNDPDRRAHAEATKKRDESAPERDDRNTIELINELRVAATGIQVLFGFLLIVPFNNRWSRVSSFEKGIYMVALICVAVATVLLIAPSIHYRLLFRRGKKHLLVQTGTRMLVLASMFMAAGLAAIMLLVSDVVLGIGGAVVIAAFVGLMIGAVWYAWPLAQRRDEG